MTVNWLAIVVAAVAAWLFGGVYYTALSKPWMAAQGKTMEQCQAEMAAKSGAAKAAPFILVFIGEIIIAWALYGILVHLNAFTLRGGIISAALIWFGFVLTTITGNYTLTDTQDRSPGSATYGNELPRRPKDAANAAVRRRIAVVVARLLRVRERQLLLWVRAAV